MKIHENSLKIKIFYEFHENSENFMKIHENGPFWRPFSGLDA